MTQQAKASGEGLDGTVWTGACTLPACGRDSLLPGKVVHDSAFFFGALAGGSPAEGIYRVASSCHSCDIPRLFSISPSLSIA